MKLNAIKPEFVPVIPEQLDEGVLYVCEPHRIAIHLCCCGCGEEVVTPLSPAEWHLEHLGTAVSLYPSIGNWSFRCQSHYWIRRNRVIWAGALSAERIAVVQGQDRAAKAAHIAEVNAAKGQEATESAAPGRTSKRTAWNRFRAWISSV